MRSFFSGLWLSVFIFGSALQGCYPKEPSNGTSNRNLRSNVYDNQERNLLHSVRHKKSYKARSMKRSNHDSKQDDNVALQSTFELLNLTLAPEDSSRVKSRKKGGIGNLDHDTDSLKKKKKTHSHRTDSKRVSNDYRSRSTSGSNKRKKKTDSSVKVTKSGPKSIKTKSTSSKREKNIFSKKKRSESDHHERQTYPPTTEPSNKTPSSKKPSPPTGPGNDLVQQSNSTNSSLTNDDGSISDSPTGGLSNSPINSTNSVAPSFSTSKTRPPAIIRAPSPDIPVQKPTLPPNKSPSKMDSNGSTQRPVAFPPRK